MGDYYHNQFGEGNRDVIQDLGLEEADLLHARRVARSGGSWGPVTSAMQGLRVLYEYQGRTAEWARLVAEIVPDYCTPDDGPIPGREDRYSLVMDYRVDLEQNYDRDLAAAAALQEKLVAWNRRQAASTLALPPAAPLDAGQRNRIRTLGVSVEILGHILRDQNNGDCVTCFEEAIECHRRTGDTATEAIAHYNLGRAYHEAPATWSWKTRMMRLHERWTSNKSAWCITSASMKPATAASRMRPCGTPRPPSSILTRPSPSARPPPSPTWA